MGLTFSQKMGRILAGILSIFGGIVVGEGEKNWTLSLPTSLLSPIKRGELQLENKRGRAQSQLQKWQWIAPITLSYSLNRTDQTGVQKYRLFSVQMNQPVFQSGAIYYSIKGGEKQGELSTLSVEKTRRQLIEQALELAIDYRITQLQLKISQLNLENNKIDVGRKREQFLAGVGDSGFLNNAIIKLNQEKVNLLQLKNQLVELRENFQKISTLDIEKVKIPQFRLVPRREYLHRNLERKIAETTAQLNYDLYRQQLGKSLFSVNFIGSWNRIHQTAPFPMEDSYYTAGIAITIPLAPANYFGVEEQKLAYLKSRLEAIDKKRELTRQYNSLLNRYRNLQRELKIYRENEEVYRRLVASTRESIKAGNATPSDLKTILNSLKISQLQQKVTYWKGQKILLQLNYLLQ
jgi:outer membrane protein TolC